MRLKSNVAECELLKYVGTKTFLMRTNAGECFYKQLFSTRESEKNKLYAEILENVKTYQFEKAELLGTQYIKKNSPNYVRNLSLCTRANDLKNVMIELGIEEAAPAIADMFCNKYDHSTLKVTNLLNLYQYRREGVKHYEILCGDDSCDLCKSFKNKHLFVSKARIGINFPPLHNGCRCRISAVE